MDRWIERDLKYNWHPYTQMKDCRRMPPILIDCGRGLALYGADGRKYLDTISSWWCNVHGHNHPRVMGAIRKQTRKLDHVLFAGFTHKPAIRLAQMLTAITPRGLTKVFFSDNGSTAVECALKMSVQFWRNEGEKEKKRFVCLDRGYHGDTVGAMSVAGASAFNRAFKPLLFSSLTAPSPYCYRCPLKMDRARCSVECAGELERLVRQNRRTVAAIIIEPLLLAAGGMIIYPPAYLRKAAAIAKRYNVHLIVDEVATGFGRTGRMFACDHVSVKPDFMCLSKGITSGSLPLGVTMTTDRVWRAFYADYDQGKTFYHGHTYTANPIACAAACASIKLFEEEDVLAKVGRLLPEFHSFLERMRGAPYVGDVRYLGFVGALELVRDKKKKTSFPERMRVGLRIYREGLRAGLLLRPLGNVIYFFLPLCITGRQISSVLRRAGLIVGNLERLL